MSGTSYTANLSASKQYRWNVNACNTSGCSSYTAVLFFQTPGTAVTTPVVTSLSTTPNPPTTAGAFTFTITGSNFYSAGALILVTGPGCAAPCIIPNSALTTKTTKTLAGTAPLLTAGIYSFVVQNGYDAQTGGPRPQSNGTNVTVIRSNISPVFSIQPSKGVRGTIFTNTGRNFTKFGEVRIEVTYAKDRPVDTIFKRADGDGNFSYDYTSQPSDPPGTHTLEVTDLTSGQTVPAQETFLSPSDGDALS